MGSFFENPLDSLRIATVRTVQLTIAEAGGSIVTQSGGEMVGDVAQLVERRNGIAEATGSTPVVSTNLLFVGFRPVCKSLAFFLNSTTLTRLLRRKCFPRTYRHEQQHSKYRY